MRRTPLEKRCIKKNRTVKWFTVMVFLFDVFRNINSIYRKVACWKESTVVAAVVVVFTFTSVVYANLDVHKTHERILQMSVYQNIYHSLSDVATTVASKSEKRSGCVQPPHIHMCCKFYTILKFYFVIFAKLVPQPCIFYIQPFSEMCAHAFSLSLSRSFFHLHTHARRP